MREENNNEKILIPASRKESETISKILDYTKNYLLESPNKAELSKITFQIKARYDENIEYLTQEIIKFNQEKERREKMKEEEPQPPNPNPTPKNSSSDIYILEMTDLNFETIQYILTKRKRSPQELLILRSFLSPMKFVHLSKTNIGKEKLLMSLSKYLRLEQRPPDNIIFHLGDKGSKFYIILKGEISVLILKEVKVEMSYFRYFLHLLLLKFLKEDELLKKIISININKDYLNESDFYNYYENLSKFVIQYFGKCSNNNRYFILPNNEDDETNSDCKKHEKRKKVNLILDSNPSSEEENDLIEKIKSPIKIMPRFSIICTKNLVKRHSTENVNIRDVESRLNASELKAGNIHKIHTRKSTLMRKKYVLHKIEGLSEKLRIAELDIPPFTRKELKDIVIYYIYLREEIANKKQSISVNQYINITSINSILHRPVKSDKMNSKSKIDFIVLHYYQIALKKSGETFGEVALQHADSKRTATMITHTNCIMGYLTKGDYDTSIRDIELRKRQGDINFIMTFAIFNQMNWILFENKYFNYFYRHTFHQGETIINIGQEADKIYFIMDGQFEVKTEMSLKRLYSLIKYKTENKFNMKMIGKNSKINLRLYISYNKDIIGLDDCCFNKSISFVSATCISTKSCVFILERNILNEMKQKIPEINVNLNKMIKERNKVMCDRLIAIFMQTFHSNKMRKNAIKNGQMNNSKNKNNKIENNYISTSKGHLRLKSAKFLNNKSNKIADYFHPTSNNISNIFNEKEEIHLDSGRNITTSNALKKNYNLSVYSPGSIKTVKTINNINSKILSPCKKENKFNFSSDIDISYELNNKIGEIFNKKNEKSTALSPERNHKFVLKLSEKLKQISNTHTKKKFASLYSPLNQIINKEYSNLFKWIDNANSKISNYSKIQDFYNSSNKCLKKPNQRYKPISNNSELNNNKLLYINNRNTKNYLNKSKISQKFLLQSTKKNKGKINLFKQKANNMYNIYDGFSDEDENDYKKHPSNNFIYNQTYSDGIKEKKVSSQFYMKQILGTKYREGRSEKMENKIKKILTNYEKRKKLKKTEELEDEKVGNKYKDPSIVLSEISSRGKEIQNQKKMSMFCNKSLKNNNEFLYKNK